MPKTDQDQLTCSLDLPQSIVVEKIAELYGIDKSAIHVHIDAPYYGGPTDSSPGKFSLTLRIPADRVLLEVPK